VGLLHLVLAESALELVPEPLWSHPAVSRSAKTRAKSPRDILLDDTHHHSAMRAAAQKRQFADPERRGRPDIVHLALLVALESRLNHEGLLRVWIHTRDDRWIEVAPDLHIQRAQHRFIGLMENLLRDGRVPPAGKGEPLMVSRSNVTLADGIRSTGATRVVVLDENGETEDSALEAVLSASGDVAVIVGGYPTGPFRNDLSAFGPVRLRLGTRPLAAWTVVAEIVVRHERALANRGADPR
jgi:rRNA small subunit pseudouridine methyltransferase Nep1